MISAPAAMGPDKRSGVMISNTAAFWTLGWPATGLHTIEPSVTQGMSRRIRVIPRLKNIRDMESLDPLNIASRSKPRKRNQDIIRERHHVALSVNECRLVIFVFHVHHRHQQRGLHIHCTMKPENRGEPFLDDTVESGVLWDVGLKVIDEPPAGPWRLTEQRR
jgi:hypothetical protein